MHWSKRTEFAEMLTDFIVNKSRVNVSVKLIPQGKGIYLDYILDFARYRTHLFNLKFT